MTTKTVKEYFLNEVVAFRKKMKAEGKVLPFFVLDEMSLDINTGGGGKNLVA